LQAAKLALNTAALKDSMNNENPQSEKEKFLEELGLAFGVEAKDLGFTKPKG
jgi:hypothetical protein